MVQASRLCNILRTRSTHAYSYDSTSTAWNPLRCMYVCCSLSLSEPEVFSPAKPKAQREGWRRAFMLAILQFTPEEWHHAKDKVFTVKPMTGWYEYELGVVYSKDGAKRTHRLEACCFNQCIRARTCRNKIIFELMDVYPTPTILHPFANDASTRSLRDVLDDLSWLCRYCPSILLASLIARLKLYTNLTWWRMSLKTQLG